jgi:hypothetical protein
MSDELSQKYRHIFLSPIGREVLADVLALCHFGCTLDPDNKVQVSEYNVAVTILSNLGVFGPDRDQIVTDALINSLVSTQPKKEE